MRLALALLIIVCASSNEGCPYILLTGIPRKEGLQDLLGFYKFDSAAEVPAYTQVEVLSQKCSKETKTCSKIPEVDHHIWAQQGEDRSLWILSRKIGESAEAHMVSKASNPLSTPARTMGDWHIAGEDGGWVKKPAIRAECRDELSDAWRESWVLQV